MRDGDGTFVGNSGCIHWKGVESIVDKVCCGGRKIKVAYVRCAVKGLLQNTEAVCHSRCSGKDYSGRRI
jgi:hypothetical protein